MSEFDFLMDDEKVDYSALPLKDKIERSIKIIKLASRMSWEFYKKPMIVCYSGGKDSDVLLNLCEKALPLSEFEVMNSHTTVDAPETVYHIRETVDRINGGGGTAKIKYPIRENGEFMSMWKLIVEKQMPPTRLMRYCCQELKETSTPNRMAILGVRAAESTKRQGRDIFGTRGGSYREAKFFSLDHTEEVFRESLEIQDSVWDCTLIRNMKANNDTVVNAIYEWSDNDIWEYIKQENIKVNPLYEMGYTRVGCVGCPLARHSEKVRDFARLPKYKENYIRAFDKMLIARKKSGKKNLGNDWHYWASGQDVFDWWLEEYKRNVKGQITIDEYLKGEEE